MKPRSATATSGGPDRSVDDRATEYFAFSTFAAASSRAKELAMGCGVPLWIRRKDERWSVVVEPRYWATFSEALGRSVKEDDERRERREDRESLSWADDPVRASDGVSEYWPGWL
jgi:hypothetical protein